MAKLYRVCKHCNYSCEESCFDSHRSRYRCHDSRCPGFAPRDRGSGGGGGSRSSSLRPEPPELHRSGSKRHSGSSSSSRREPSSRGTTPGSSRGTTPTHSRSTTPTPPASGMCYVHDAQTGERYGHPRDPHEDRDHLRLRAKYAPLRRGFRYSYNKAGEVVSFAVSRDAFDYVDPERAEHRRHAPSRSGSVSYRSGGGDGGLPKRSYSTREDTRRPRDYDEGGREGREGLGRRPSTGRRYQPSREEYYGGGGRSYDSMRSRYQSDTYNRSYGGSGSERREYGGGGSSSLRPEDAYGEPRRRIVKPEDVDWEIETVV